MTGRPGRQWRRVCACVVAVSTCIGAQALAQPRPATATTTATATAPGSQPAMAADLRSELLALEGKLAALQDLTTRFTQQKFTPMLRKPLTSAGTIRVRQNLMRWDTEKPAPSSMLIGESEIRMYYPKQKVMEIYPIDEQLGRLAASPVPRIAVMQEHFSFERGSAKEMDASADDSSCLAVTLTPKQETLKQHIEHVKLLIDRNSAYLRQMEMIDADGDRTVIRFDEVKLNSGLSAQDLELKVPAGTRISRPLSGQTD